MNKAIRMWQLILQSLKGNVPVMLLYVLESKGSSPGRQGFCMCVNAHGAMEGSIGGGIMEYKFVETAKEKLLRKESESLVKKQIHDKAATSNQSGMICSGEQTILLYPIQKHEQGVIEEIVECLSARNRGRLQLNPSGIHFSNDVDPEKYVFNYVNDDDWYFYESVGLLNQLYVIGAGHCSVPFCKIMSMLEFNIHLYDNRPGLKTFDENIYAHNKVLVQDYKQLNQLIADDENAFVVVMTFGYRTDDIVIRALINKRFRYFGVLGSRSKIDQMFSQYKKEGISEDLINKLYAPIGLQIKSESIEEIAVSIAAQIIAVKNKQLA